MDKKLDIGENSDGYHTFNELYEHRHLLFLSLIKLAPYRAWYSKYHDDGSSIDGWFVAGLHLPHGDITYHLPMSKWDLIGQTDAVLIRYAPKWDGHTSNNVLERLGKLIES